MSDLIKSPSDTCFELTRGGSQYTCPKTVSGQLTCQHKSTTLAKHNPSPLQDISRVSAIKTRLRSSSKITNFKLDTRGGAENTCQSSKVSTSTSGNCECMPSVTRPGLRRSIRGVAYSCLVDAGSVITSPKQRRSNDRWVMARRTPETGVKRDCSKVSVFTKSSKGQDNQEDDEKPGENVGVMTRSRKRKLIDPVHEASEVMMAAKKSKIVTRSAAKRHKITKVKREKVKKLSKVDEEGNIHDNNVEADDTNSDNVVKIQFSDWEKHQVYNQDHWQEPDSISYREIVGYPHLNECVNSLEILNIGGSNVLGEFIPFLLLHTPKLKSLGQWLNTMIYGLEILKVE